jgi:hypothetical protein
MLKLYKRIDDTLHYWEAWKDKPQRAVVEHWGIVGERGESKKHPMPRWFGQNALVDKLRLKAIAAGYEDFDVEAVLVIEYMIDGWGSDADLDKRHSLEERMDDVLGWSGLGHCDGGSIGSGSMEVACFVVDFEIAKRMIEADLASTEFGDYARIYREDEEVGDLRG